MNPETTNEAEVVIPTEEIVVTEEVVAEEMAQAPSDGVVNDSVCTSCEG
jgi:hypothetical protein